MFVVIIQKNYTQINKCMSVDIFNLNSFPERRFIKSGFQKSTTLFTGHNEEEHHKKNLGVFSSKYWKYTNTKIDYVHNSDGFRCNQELDQIDWSKTSVVIGCSYIYGQGIENSNTISEILTREYGEPFVNAGIPGSSNRTIHNNVITFMQQYNPKKIIILWSYPTRHTWMHLEDYGDGNRWESINVMPGFDEATRKKRIVHDKVPSVFFDIECHNSIHEWMTAIDVQTLLGNKQYYAIDKYIDQNDDANWIKPIDTRLYDLKLLHEQGEMKFSLNDLQTPEPYELINSLYGRDLNYDPTAQLLGLGHFGEAMNKDIADLIYRENFK